jgi:diadenosine tetraphosphate (Ap4A) HIT family hydrolase
MRRRPPPGLDEYLARARRGCFVCAVVARDPEYPRHVVYEDARAIAFLNAFPTLLGTVLVAPLEHREQVTADFDLDEYLDLQRVVYRVAEAIRQVVPTERSYVLSLGSGAANSHVHWHVAPLPPGVPFEEQQLAALSWDAGVLDVSETEQAALAERLRTLLAQTP